MKRLTRRTALASILLVVSLLAACSSSSSSGTKSSAVSGGTATFALAAGNVPDWILPLVTAANATTPNISFFQFLLYRPLFWFGGPGSAGLNESQSIANTPTFTTSNGKTTANITLKHYVWSDGKPVTARDVQFWYNLLTAEKANWWDYSPGGFPEDAVVLTDASVDLYNPKAVRASVGSLYHLPVAVGVPVEQAVAGLRAAGVRILAADGAGERDLDQELDDGTLGGPTAWVFGNEAWGLPEPTRALADEVVRVPIHGHAESLNLATAAAVCLYASARAQRAPAGCRS